MKKYILVLFLFLSVYSSISQVTPVWSAAFHQSGNPDDEITAMTVDNNGNVFVTGRSKGNTSQEDYVTIKYNLAGNIVWTAIYNGPANSFDIPMDITIDNLNNVYVTGYSNGGASEGDIATIKYNAAGIQQWIVRYNGPANGFDGGRSLAIDNSGNVFITGYSLQAATGFDAVTIKYNSSGIQQWVVFYNGPDSTFDEGIKIMTDNSGNVNVACNSNGGGFSDCAVIKYNSSGVQLWTSRYNGTDSKKNIISSSKTDAAGNIYITGYSEGISSYDDYLTIKFNSSGFLQWAKLSIILSIFTIEQTRLI